MTMTLSAAKADKLIREMVKIEIADLKKLLQLLREIIQLFEQ